MNWNPGNPNPPNPDVLSDSKESILPKLVLGGCGCLILIGILFAFFAGKMFLGVMDPARTVKEHLKALNEGNLDHAYSLFSLEYRRNHSFATFKAEVDAFSDAFPLANSSLKHVNIQNDRATVEGMFTGRNGVVFPVQYQLVREKKEWKINGYTWESPGKQQLI